MAGPWATVLHRQCTFIAPSLFVCRFPVFCVKLNVTFEYMILKFIENLRDIEEMSAQTAHLEYFFRTWTVSKWLHPVMPAIMSGHVHAIDPVPFHYITFVYVLFFSTLRMAVQHLQGWTGEYLCLICWNQKQVSPSFCIDETLIIMPQIYIWYKCIETCRG